MSRSEHHEKDTVHVALFVSFVNDCLFSTFVAAEFVVLRSVVMAEAGFTWGLETGERCDNAAKRRDRFWHRGACGELLAFVSTFICDKLYYRMAVLCQTHSEALPMQRWVSTACRRADACFFDMFVFCFRKHLCQVQN